MSIITYPNVPLLQQDLIGNKSNYYPTKQNIYLLGRHPDVNNTEVDLWEGPTNKYVFPTIAQQMQIVSTSANDTSAGTGIRTVMIHYLDTNYLYNEITLTMNGVTPVTTVPTNILRINKIHANSVGSGRVAAGVISLTNIGATITYALISLGQNSSRQAVFTIPSGKTGYLSHWQGSSGSASGTHFTRLTIKATHDGGDLLPGVFIAMDEQGTLNNGTTGNYSLPLVVPAMADFIVSGISDAGAAHVIAMTGIFGWIE